MPTDDATPLLVVVSVSSHDFWHRWNKQAFKMREAAKRLGVAASQQVSSGAGDADRGGGQRGGDVDTSSRRMATATRAAAREPAWPLDADSSLDADREYSPPEDVPYDPTDIELYRRTGLTSNRHFMYQWATRVTDAVSSLLRHVPQHERMAVVVRLPIAHACKQRYWRDLCDRDVGLDPRNDFVGNASAILDGMLHRRHGATVARLPTVAWTDTRARTLTTRVRTLAAASRAWRTCTRYYTQ
jgi:hypothetical protein